MNFPPASEPDNQGALLHLAARMNELEIGPESSSFGEDRIVEIFQRFLSRVHHAEREEVTCQSDDKSTGISDACHFVLTTDTGTIS